MELVSVDRDGAVAVVTLNDPQRRNAMSVAMGHALSSVFATLSADEDLRAVVLTGAPPAFSAGGDLAMLEDFGHRARSENFDATADMYSFYRRFLALGEAPVPVIAAVNGHAIGAGLCVALRCDMMVVSDEARLGLNFSRLGLHPGMGATWTLPRRLGKQRASELLYTGRLFSGSEAVDMGMAIEAHPPSRVFEAAVSMAGEVASSSPLVVRQLKASLESYVGNSLDEQLWVEAAAQAIDLAGEDFREGIEAIRERRQPRY